MAMAYVKLFTDYLEAIEPLGDGERGRLFTALLKYAKTGEAPHLTGNERYIFPILRAQIDRDAAEWGKQVSNGAKGGRPAKNQTKPTETQPNPTKPNKTQQNQEEEKEEDKDKEEDKKEKGTIVPEKKVSAFRRPTVAEVAAYCAERGNGVDPEAFVAFYDSKGWVVGKSPMKSWKAAVVTWEKAAKAHGGRSTPSRGTVDKMAVLRGLHDEYAEDAV